MPTESRFDGIAVMPVTFCFPNMSPKIWNNTGIGSHICTISVNAK